MKRLQLSAMRSWQKFKRFKQLRVQVVLFGWVFIFAMAMPLASLAADDGSSAESDGSDELRWSFKRGAALETQAGTRLLGVHVGISPGLTLSSIKEPDERRTSVDQSLARLRLRVAGAPVPLRLAYNVSLSFDKAVLSLKDVWLDAALGSPRIWIRAGQLRRAFSRQGLTPYFRMVMPDRPLTYQIFESGHDPGVMLHGGPWSSFEWSLAFLKGGYQSPSQTGEFLRREISSEERSSATADSVLLRLARRSKRGDPYNESDSAKLPFRWSVGMSLLAMKTDEESSRGALQGQVDLQIAARGWTLLGAFFVATEQEEERIEEQAFQGAGYTLQTSYLVGESFEPSIRFTHCVFPGADTDIKDISAGFSLSFYRGRLRWLNRLGMTIRDIEDGYRSDVTYKSHLQFHY